MKQGWEIKKLSEIGKVFNGNSINEKVKKDKYTNLDNGLPFIATKDVGFDSSIDYENGVRILFNEINQFKIAPSNTPLICAEGGSAGRKIGFTNQDVCFGNKLFAFVPNKNLESKYIFYYYFTSSFQKHFSTEMAGIIGGVSTNKFKDIEIPLPPLPEQQRIVAILDEVFAAIAKAKANAEQNLKNAKELFESYLQGVFENGKEKWEEKLLDEVCEFRNGAAHERHIDEDGKYILVNSKFISADGEKFKRTNSALAPLYVNDIAFVMSDVPNGKALAKCFLVDENDTYTLNQRIGAIKPIAFVPEFLVYQLNRNKYLLSFNNGENQTNLRKGDILKCPLWVPAKEDQQAIVRQLDALRAETQKLEAVYQKKVADLEELKKSILQKAFAGELRSPEGAEYTNDVATPIAKKKTITSPERA
jgi:type I restriction enzyme S subunit